MNSSTPSVTKELKKLERKYPNSWETYRSHYSHKDKYDLFQPWIEYETILKAITKAKLEDEFGILFESGRYPLRIAKLFKEDESYWKELFAPYYHPEDAERRALKMQIFFMKLHMIENM